MHIIIIGAGKIGSSLAEWFISLGHEIAVVEQDPIKCSILDDKLGSVTVQGDGTSKEILLSAGTNRGDIFIATTNSDDVNLVACQMAKYHFGISKTVSIVNDHDLTEFFESLGIDIPIDSTEVLLNRIQQGLISEGTVHLMSVSDFHNRILVSIKIPAESHMQPTILKDISIPNETLICLIITTNGNAAIPKNGSMINPGDEIIAVTTPENEGRLRELLIKGPDQ